MINKSPEKEQAVSLVSPNTRKTVLGKLNDSSESEMSTSNHVQENRADPSPDSEDDFDFFD